MADVVFVLPNGAEVDQVKIKWYDEEPEPVDAWDCYGVSPSRVRAADWRRLGQKGEAEKLSFWDIGNLLQSAGAFLRDRLNLEVAESARYSRDEAQSFLASAVEVIAEIKKTADDVRDAGEEAYSEYTKVYEKLYEMRRDFLAKVKELAPVEVPYRLKEMVDFAERCEGMSPEAWERVIELAEVLNKDKGAARG